MNLAAIQATLEKDLKDRWDELRFLKNIAAQLRKPSEQDRYRRCLVPMLYAHFEGFSKVALTEYASQVNNAGLKCKDAKFAIVASTWADVLHDLEDMQNRSGMFSQSIGVSSDDSRLKRLIRRAQFVEVMALLDENFAYIHDRNLDFESNLNSRVLRKLLFALGLDHGKFDAIEKTLNNLLHRRNTIAHGQDLNGIESKAYEKFEKLVYYTMQEMILIVVSALKNKEFRRPA